MDLDQVLTRGVSNIISSKEELKKALSDKKLNIYLGIDPTATKIHLGNTVPLRILQKFAKFGHNVTFLIGDFTALIGDTSDKDAERPVLTKEEIENNFKTYKEQAEKILDFSKVKVRYNSEWLSKLSFEEIVKLCQHFSVGDFVGRELVRERLKANKRVGLHELLYPVMQGYDSYFMDIDLQIGGTDQTFNMQAGRTLQKDLRNKQSFILANEFLEGTDGRKMSKSWGNAIWIDDGPNDMFAKVMAIKDDLILRYYELATDVPMDKIEKAKEELDNGTNPIEVKKQLAFEIVKELNGESEANSAQENFTKTVQGKEEAPLEEMEVDLSVTNMLPDVLINALGVVESNSELKRLIEQNGIKHNGRLLETSGVELSNGDVISIGKRKNIQIKSK